MQPKKFFTRFAADVVKRSGICQATVEAVLPHVFDEIRSRLAEGRYPCVPIESFGTFGVVDIPAREYHNTYKGQNRLVQLPPRKRFKFYPTRNLTREIEAGQFDPSRRSFVHHSDDPTIRKREKMKYQPLKTKVFKGQTTVLGKSG